MDAAPVMIWVSGVDKHCTWFNKPWLEFTGRTMAQEGGYGWAEGIHRDDLERCVDIYVRHFDQRTPFRIEYRLRRADGEYRWILETGAPRFGATREFLGYVGSCIDINLIKRAQPGFDGTAAAGDAALDALDRVAGRFAHEFNNLVGAVVGHLWLIRKNAHDAGVAQRLAQEAEQAAVQGMRMAEQLLAAMRHRPRLATMHVNRLVADTWALLRGSAGERVSLEMDLAADPDDAVGDPGHLQAALLNLVINARDAMAEGGTVWITTTNMTVGLETLDELDSPPGRYIVLAVRDSGAGMSDEVLQHAFEPLFTTKAAGRGTGLGLFQVRAFARDCGGSARIESVPGNGTTVRLYLPQA